MVIDLLPVQCEEILKEAFSLNQKILYMFSAPITELGSYLSSIDEKGSEFLSDLFDRVVGKPSNNLTISQLVAMLTSGVNFINISRTNFSYESALHSFSLATFWLWRKYKSTFVQKNGHVKC